MSADTIRMLGTYVIAVLVLIGAFVLLMFESQVPSEQLIPFLTGFVGIVLGWAFNRESTTAGARASERSMAVGQATGTGATVVTGSNPQIGPNDQVRVA
jgi:membrane-bound ClpP family serine protease